MLFFFDKNEIFRGFANPADVPKLIEKSYVPEVICVSWHGTNEGNLVNSQSLKSLIIIQGKSPYIPQYRQALKTFLDFVIPAKAGIHINYVENNFLSWIPASAGMTIIS